MIPHPPDVYSLSLHDALPICHRGIYRRLIEEDKAAVVHPARPAPVPAALERVTLAGRHAFFYARGRDGKGRDRKSTRLNSSHRCISYAVFCLKKKKTNTYIET